MAATAPGGTRPGNGRPGHACCRRRLARAGSPPVPLHPAGAGNAARPRGGHPPRAPSAGLGLDPNSGVLSGTPTAQGTTKFTVVVYDSYSPPLYAAPQDFSITISPA
ncbi:MAG: putative Ig domain-containing protein [Streptosporangiaceae bacterium]|nr:putative Ig domain-containing protein [Streptosporangiaceae bacterium]